MSDDADDEEVAIAEGLAQFDAEDAARVTRHEALLVQLDAEDAAQSPDPGCVCSEHDADVPDLTDASVDTSVDTLPDLNSVSIEDTACSADTAWSADTDRDAEYIMADVEEADTLGSNTLQAGDEDDEPVIYWMHTMKLSPAVKANRVSFDEIMEHGGTLQQAFCTPTLVVHSAFAVRVKHTPRTGQTAQHGQGCGQPGASDEAVH